MCSEKTVLAVLTCIGIKHDLRLVVLAALICTLSAGTSMGALARARRASPSNRLLWLLLAGAVGGAGVWATHFVAMLAYSPGLPIQYGLETTVMSLAIAVVGASAAFILTETGRGRPLLGGALLGGSIALMHYCGVMAIQAFQVRWDPAYAAASVLISLLGAAAALWVARRGGLTGRVAAPAILVLGICGLHFTAMTALTVIPDPASSVSRELISRPILAVAVGLVGVLILAGAAVLILLETHSRRSSLRTLETVFNSRPEGAALFDPTLRLVLWNTAYSEMIAAMGAELRYGMTKRALNQALADAGRLNPGQLAAFAAPADAPLSTTESVLPDGRIIELERRQLDDGSRLSICSDVTEQRRWAKTMEDARVKAEDASRAKSEFLANMSHELRTPLNGVIGMVQAVQQGDLSAEQRVRVEVVHESARSLLHTLDDVLDLAKIEGGRTGLTIETFELAGLALSVCGVFAAAAANKGLTLKVTVAPSVAGWWSGDAGKLRRLLGHLIDNGLKFTPAGGVTLDIVPSGGALSFQVRDTGIGFDPAQSERLFDSFVQGDASATRSFGGSGVGLSLCREWARAMGGVISAESQLGRGARFTVELPLERAEAPPEPAAKFELFPVEAPSRAVAGPEPAVAAQTVREPAAAPPVEAEEPPLRVLAAEDNETNQLVLRSLLQTMDVDLTVVANGRLAVEAFAAKPFDLVLMDIQMPEMNGVDATRAIRALEVEQGRAQTPIIALTANVMPDQQAEYRTVGMTDCVGKPIQLEVLFNAMALALNAGLDAAA